MSIVRQLATGLIEAGVKLTQTLFTGIAALANTIWEYLLYPIANALFQAITIAGTALINVSIALLTGLAKGLFTLAKASWNTLIYPIGSALAKGIGITARFSWERIARPLGATGFNLFGYVVEKALFGPPSLRAYANTGVFPANVEYGKRYKLVSKFGFDPYSHFHPIVDNLFGVVFGLGLGLFQYLNFASLFIKHFFISFGYNLKVAHNFLLGPLGLFGERRNDTDHRESVPIRVVFGILSAPAVAAAALVTNALDLGFTGLGHTLQSAIDNSIRTFNILLGAKGTFGERRSVSDEKRHPATQILFGILSVPLVIPVVLTTNALDISYQLIKHTAISSYYNIKSSFNLLGQYGVMGERHDFEDHRASKSLRFVFGLLSSPIVLPTILLSNLIDAMSKVGLESVRSIHYNVRASRNVLGWYDLFGTKPTYDDKRIHATRIGYGLLTLPVVLPITLLSNTAFFVAAMIYNTAYSYSVNMQYLHSFIKIHKDVEDAPDAAEFKDERSTAAIIFFSITSLPFVIPSAIISYATIGGIDFIHNTALSIKHNTLRYYNFLGKYGQFGPRQEYSDPRPSRGQRIVFGLLTLPIVAPCVLVSNVADIMLTSVINAAKQTAWSVQYNTLRFYNLLGTYGELGPRQPYLDNRHWALIGVFGLISSPIVLPTLLITNLVDITLSLGHQTLTSFQLNFARTHNIVLGHHGIYGPRKRYEDTRSGFAQFVFGLTSLPFVVVAASISNTLDIVYRTLEQALISYARNTRPLMNLLGSHGQFGARQPYADDRHWALIGLFFLPTLPFVVCSAVVTNLVDAHLTLLKRTYQLLSSKRFWKTVAGILGGAVAATIALPAFMARRWSKSAYYLARGRQFDTDPNSRRIKKAIANVFTLGLASLVFKFFDYSTRFRSDYMEQGSDQVKQSKQGMKELIKQAQRGLLELEQPSSAEENDGDEVEIERVNVDQSSQARMMLRFIGLKHESENILKEVDDAYRAYLNDDSTDERPENKTLGNFFISQRGKAAVREVKLNVGQEKQDLVDTLVSEVSRRTTIEAGV